MSISSLIQLEGPIEENIGEDLSAFLEEDTLSVTWYEEKQDRWLFQALYHPTSEKLLQEKITQFFQERKLPLPNFTSRVVPQEDWVAAVYRDSPPLIIGGFYIYGSHIQNDPPPTLIPLRVDAATAFGSGQHESTEGCLRALTKLAEHQTFERPLDMGCGSGILALAMASLWKVPVLGGDNDPECIRVTLENAHLNHLDSYVSAELSEGFTSIKNRHFDIITANILAGPLCHMAPDASRALTPGGYIILAGLLNRQAEDVIDAYRSVGIKLADQLFIGDWSTLIMRKDNNG